MGDRRNARNYPTARPWRNKPALTPRQAQCVDLLIEGYRVKDIGLQLGIRPTCVSEILHDAMYRTGTKTREELAAWWALRKVGFQTGLLQDTVKIQELESSWFMDSLDRQRLCSPGESF